MKKHIIFAAALWLYVGCNTAVLADDYTDDAYFKPYPAKSKTEKTTGKDETKTSVTVTKKTTDTTAKKTEQPATKSAKPTSNAKVRIIEDNGTSVKAVIKRK